MKMMTWRLQRSRAELFGAVCALLLVGMFVGLGFYWGTTRTMREDLLRFQQHEALEARIMAWIVERNPEAKIRDFQGFPQALFRTAQEIGIEWEWLLALADTESSMKPDAVGMAGEIGLMQILPTTGRLIAQKLGEEFEPPKMGGRDRVTARPIYVTLGSLGEARTNLRWGAYYLKWQKDQFKSWPTALRAYNRNPDHARQHRPWDRYAETVTFRFVDLREQFRFVSRI